MEKVRSDVRRPRKVNVKPRFSVNKLGEYLTAIPNRRKKLIFDQKFPNAYITSAYKIAKEAIIKFIINDYDETILDKAIAELKKSSDLSDNDRVNSISILKNIRNNENLPDLSKYEKLRYSKKSAKIKIKGLDISICPDIILKRKNKVGCIKIHLIKSEQYRLNKDASQYVSTLLYKYLDLDVISEEETIDYNAVISLDCFGDSFEVAPKSIIRRMGNIEAACEEIVSRWDSVTFDSK